LWRKRLNENWGETISNRSGPEGGGEFEYKLTTGDLLDHGVKGRSWVLKGKKLQHNSEKGWNNEVLRGTKKKKKKKKM